jgi:hypothetical protein
MENLLNLMKVLSPQESDVLKVLAGSYQNSMKLLKTLE